MVIGRGRRREHPNQHFVLVLRKKDEKKSEKIELKRNTKKVLEKRTGTNAREKVRWKKYGE